MEAPVDPNFHPGLNPPTEFAIEERLSDLQLHLGVKEDTQAEQQPTQLPPQPQPQNTTDDPPGTAQLGLEENELESLATPLAPITSSDRVAADGNLTVRSKRTERMRRKTQKKQAKMPRNGDGIDGIPLPSEVFLVILSHLRPSDLFVLLRTSKYLRGTVLNWQASLAKDIIDARYSCLASCLRLPVLLSNVDEECHSALCHADRQSVMGIHKKFQHVLPPDPSLICTCLTCILRWNSLCLIVDFARWQSNLDCGTPIPMVPRGKAAAWNESLVADNAQVVREALTSPLWYARILEKHLQSTVRAIKRNSENKGNRRQRFEMTRHDENSETGVFLQRRGPATMDFPFHRDNYYLLEAYLPNRAWNKEKEYWMYLPDLHERDLQWVFERWGPSREESPSLEPIDSTVPATNFPSDLTTQP